MGSVGRAWSMVSNEVTVFSTARLSRKPTGEGVSRRLLSRQSRAVVDDGVGDEPHLGEAAIDPTRGKGAYHNLNKQ